MRVLVIGFGPFPGAPCNPSAVLARALARRRRPALAETIRSAHVLPTRYAAVDHQLPKLLAAKPDVVLLFGLASRRRHVCVETTARNMVSVLFPDADAQRPRRSVIAPGRPPAVRGAAPFFALVGALRRACVPVRLSHDAGRYLCNYAYWRALEHARGRGGRPLVQFIHIPPVRCGPQRRGLRRISFPVLLAASESALITLIAASRR